MTSTQVPYKSQSAIKVQLNVLRALMLREIRGRFGHKKMGYLWAFVEPLIGIIFFLTLFSFISRSSPLHGDLPFFFLTGILPYQTFTGLVNKTQGAYQANRALFSYPHVHVFDVTFIRLVLEFLIMLIVFGLVSSLLVLAGIDVFFDNWFTALLAFLVICLCGYGLGMINAVLVSYYSSLDQILAVTLRVGFFVSGIFFIADTLPESFKRVLYYNPLLHMVEWLRSSLYPDYQSNFYSLSVILWTTLILCGVGLTMQYVFKDKLRAG